VTFLKTKISIEHNPVKNTITFLVDTADDTAEQVFKI
jgi:hypothetical protein